MRPRSVALGEQLYAGSIVLTIVLSAIGWEQTVAAGGLLLAIGVNAFVIGLSALLLILTTRRGSRVALGFLAALTVVNLIGYLIQIGSGVVASGWFGVITTVQTLLSVVAVVLLFRPNARAWFRGGNTDVTSQPGSGNVIIGYGTLIIAAILALYAMFMETSVQSNGMDVVNMSLLSARQILVIAAGFLGVIGVILVVFARRINR